MTHLWVRAEQRSDEQRVGISRDGVRALIDQGIRVSVEESPARILPISEFAQAGAQIRPENSWPRAPDDAFIFGLKELPEDTGPLHHRHIMFGHAFKGQASGQNLLARFRDGGGTLYDLEYLTDKSGRRVAAFGYWAGFVGAAVSMIAYSAQVRDKAVPAVSAWANADLLVEETTKALDQSGFLRPNAIVVGALGRVGSGASDLCKRVGVGVTKWDMAETADGGPFPEILNHEVFFNCILALPETPRLVPAKAGTMARKLRMIGDIACDPDSAYNPVPLYQAATTWDAPVVRTHDAPPLDVMAIDNLPSLLPLESALDYSAQLLPTLQRLTAPESGPWQRAKAVFDSTIAELP